MVEANAAGLMERERVWVLVSVTFLAINSEPPGILTKI